MWIRLGHFPSILHTMHPVGQRIVAHTCASGKLTLYLVACPQARTNAPARQGILIGIHKLQKKTVRQAIPLLTKRL